MRLIVIEYTKYKKNSFIMNINVIIFLFITFIFSIILIK